MTDAEAAPVPEDPFPEDDEVMDAEGGDNAAVRRAIHECNMDAFGRAV